VPWKLYFLGEIWEVMGKVFMLTLFDFDWLDVPWLPDLFKTQFTCACIIAVAFPLGARKYHAFLEDYKANSGEFWRTVCYSSHSPNLPQGELSEKEEVRDTHNSKLKEQKDNVSELEAVKNATGEQLKEADTQNTIAETEHSTAVFNLEKANDKYSEAKREVTRLDDEIANGKEKLLSKTSEIKNSQQSFISGVTVCLYIYSIFCESWTPLI
jgi:hypothetical protein